MEMAETLRSYLVKIGFDIDSSSQAKSEGVMVKTTALAIGLEHAFEGLAKKGGIVIYRHDGEL